MWKRAIIIGILVIIINIIWCREICNKPTEPVDPAKPAPVDVFIDNDCLVVYADGATANPVEADVGEFVVWHNAYVESDSEVEVVILFTSESPFYAGEFTIPPGGVFVAQVKPDANETTYDFTVKCGSGSPGTGPKLKVGGGP